MKDNRVKKILFVGTYDKDYSRTSIFLDGLRKNNIYIYELNFKCFSLIGNLKLIFKKLKILKRENYDLILTHSTNYVQYYFSKILSKFKKIPFIYDIYISKLQTSYYDRRLFMRKKLPKKFYPPFLYLQDLFECRFSDYLILDTYAHIKFFYEKFNIPLKKFRRVFIGAHNDIFYPLNEINLKKNNNFVVGFWGTFIPLQGIQYIIKAAKILESDKQIKFILIGNGQTYNENKNLAENLKLNNLKFYGFIPIKKLPDYIKTFDIGLGIFGDTPKTLQVIPNKIYEGNAMKLPMITSDTPAIRELFKNNESILLCKRANPKSLADAILKLKNDEKLREEIKHNAYEIFLKNCTINVIGKRLIEIFNNILMNK